MSVCDRHISLTVSQTDPRFQIWFAHGTKLCILDFQDFCLRFSKDDYLHRPSSRSSVLFPRGPLVGVLCPISMCDKPTPGTAYADKSEKCILPTGTCYDRQRKLH